MTQFTLHSQEKLYLIIFSSYMNVAIYFQECYFVELIIICC